MRKIFSVRVVALATVLAFGAVSAKAAPGDLDGSFGAGGIVITDFTLSSVHYESANALIVQSDGKLVAAGRAVVDSLTRFALARYNPDGSLDHSFGSGGLVTTGIGPLGIATANALVLQSDGKIVAAGSNAYDPGGGAFALARYNPDGSLDNSFGSGGIVITDIGPAYVYAQAHALTIQPDGRLVAAGSARMSDGVTQFALVRYNLDGSLDSSFGSGGISTTRIAPGDDLSEAAALLVQPDGKLVAAGSVSMGPSATGYKTHFAIVRFDSDGSLDTSFDSDGIAITPVGPRNFAIATDVAIQPDGKLVTAGYAYVNTGAHFAVTRYHSNGALDTSFGSGGIVTTGIGQSDYGIGQALVIEPNGNIVVAGNTLGVQFALVRYRSNGVLDTSFGNGGGVITQIGELTATDVAVARALLLQSDGKLVVAGSAGLGLEFALARYFGGTINSRPDCSGVMADISVLNKPSHGMELITLNGATDPDGDVLTLTITGVTQDEPVNGQGDGDTEPDAQAGPASNQVYIRGERSGKGDGRVYRIAFTVTDSNGGTCSGTGIGSGTVQVSVPRSQNGNPAVDSGLVFDSFGL